MINILTPHQVVSDQEFKLSTVLFFSCNDKNMIARDCFFICKRSRTPHTDTRHRNSDWFFGFRLFKNQDLDRTARALKARWHADHHSWCDEDLRLQKIRIVSLLRRQQIVVADRFFSLVFIFKQRQQPFIKVQKAKAIIESISFIKKRNDRIET